MSYTQATGMENFLRIESLVAKNRHDIQKREVDNNNNIYLYNAGAVWVAFEYSAFQLELMTDDLDGTLVFRLKDYPLPFVLKVIDDIKVRKLCKYRKDQDLIQIQVPALNKDSFNNWYRELIMDFSEM